jgi:hypothetical protein
MLVEEGPIGADVTAGGRADHREQEDRDDMEKLKEHVARARGQPLAWRSRLPPSRPKG